MVALADWKVWPCLGQNLASLADISSRFRTRRRGTANACSLAGAKSVQEVIELQTTYAKSALDAYIAEVSKMSDIVSSSVKDAVKPLNERVTAAVERLQAAR